MIHEPKTAPHAASARAPVLVIDDNDVDRETMVELLREAGFAPRGLPSPIGATRAARELGARVVIIDQNLPAMDGNKLAALFRGNRGMRDVKVVLISGNDESAMADIARLAGVDAFVCKRNMHLELAPTVRRLTA